MIRQNPDTVVTTISLKSEPNYYTELFQCGSSQRANEITASKIMTVALGLKYKMMFDVKEMKCDIV